MEARDKILVLDDESDWLDVCREFLTLLPSKPDKGDLRDIENAWHTIYIGWHSILGQIKIRQRNGDTSVFGRKK